MNEDLSEYLTENDIPLRPLHDGLKVGDIDIRSIVQENHPDAAVDTMLEETIRKLFPELLAYGPGTVPFLKNVAAVVEIVFPYETPEQVKAYDDLLPIQYFRTLAFLPPNLPILGSGQSLDYSDYEKQLQHDFPELREGVRLTKQSLASRSLICPIFMCLLSAHTYLALPDMPEAYRRESTECLTFFNEWLDKHSPRK